MNNPYSAPTATLSGALADNETYDPKVFAVNGRIGRLRYLAYSMLLSLALMVVLAIGGVLAATVGGDGGGAMIAILVIFIYIPSFAISFIMAKRRLNDLDHSGWMSLLMLVPLVNAILALYLIFAPGTQAANRFGPAPSKNSTLVVVGALLLPVIFVVGILAAVAIPAYQDYTVRAQEMQMEQSQDAQTQEAE